MCPQSCGKCCEDSPDYKFMTAEVGEKGYDWLTTNQIQTVQSIDLNTRSRTVRDQCVESCNVCVFESYSSKSPSASPMSSACTKGWTDVDCNIPACSSPCAHGICTGPDTCICDTGYSGTTCYTFSCDASPCAHGICTGLDTCTCDTRHSGTTYGEFACSSPSWWP